MEPVQPSKGLSVGSRQILGGGRVCDSILQPMLNMGRFFVGDSVPILPDAAAVNAGLKDVKARNLPVTPPAEVLLTKVLVLLVKHRKGDEDLRQGLGLLAGLILLVIEDDYFYVPETTEEASNDKIEELAKKLLRGHRVNVRMVEKAVAQHGLALATSEDLPALRAKLPDTPEYAKVLGKLEVHLKQGEGLLHKQTDPARRAAHAARFALACKRTLNLLGRLLAIPPASDHARLRKRIISRELKQIEIDALGAAQISDKEQAEEARKLLAQTGVEPGGQDLSQADAAEVAAQLAAINDEASLMESSEGGDGEEGGWFFDMD
ncbi:MAG: hypothetical protein AB7N76_23805 [Planctomycetota bacterium]